MPENLKLIKYTNGSLSSAIRSTKMRMDDMVKSIRAAERRMNDDIEDIYDRMHPDRINSLHTGEKTVKPKKSPKRLYTMSLNIKLCNLIGIVSFGTRPCGIVVTEAGLRCVSYG